MIALCFLVVHSLTCLRCLLQKYGFKSWVIFVLVFYNYEQTFQKEMYSERHYLKFFFSFKGIF